MKHESFQFRIQWRVILFGEKAVAIVVTLSSIYQVGEIDLSLALVALEGRIQQRLELLQRLLN